MAGRKQIKLAVLLIISVIFISGSARADSAGLVTGNLATADACGFGLGYLSGNLGLGDNTTSFFGTLTYGFSQYTEGRIKLGLSDGERTDASLLFGADFKYELLDYYDASHPAPVDLALGGFMEWIDYDGISVLQIGGNIISSIPYRFKGGQKLVPYGRINIRLEKLSNGNSNTELELGLNLGTKFELSNDLSFYGEIQIDGNTGLFLATEMRVF